MNTPEMPEINKMTQLTETFSTACKKLVVEGKVVTRAAPVVTIALVALTVAVKPQVAWA